MFRKFRETLHPFNRPRNVYDDTKDIITIGATYINTFRLDFNYLMYVFTNAPKDAPANVKVDRSKAKVIYKQGFDVVLEKYPEDFVIDEYLNCCYLTVKLSPEETKLFKHNYLDVSVQIMIMNKHKSVLYDVPSKLRVRTPNDYIEDKTINALK